MAVCFGAGIGCWLDVDGVGDWLTADMSGPVFFLNGCLEMAPPSSIHHHLDADAQACWLYAAGDLPDPIAVCLGRWAMQTGVEGAV